VVVVPQVGVLLERFILALDFGWKSFVNFINGALVVKMLLLQAIPPLSRRNIISRLEKAGPDEEGVDDAVVVRFFKLDFSAVIICNFLLLDLLIVNLLL